MGLFFLKCAKFPGLPSLKDAGNIINTLLRTALKAQVVRYGKWQDITRAIPHVAGIHVTEVAGSPA